MTSFYTENSFHGIMNKIYAIAENNIKSISLVIILETVL